MTTSELRPSTRDEDATRPSFVVKNDDRDRGMVHQAVVTASSWSYRTGGEDVRLAQDLAGAGFLNCPDILLPSLRRAEHVVTEESLEAFDGGRWSSLRDAGYDLWALVPLAAVARAHECLRGVVDRIQPWWIENGRVRFGEPRLP
jgi:hypothetical protein